MITPTRNCTTVHCELTTNFIQNTMDFSGNFFPRKVLILMFDLWSEIVTLKGTRSAVASGKSLYSVEMSVGSLSYARDLLRVARENPLVSYPILDPWRCFEVCGEFTVDRSTVSRWANHFRGGCMRIDNGPRNRKADNINSWKKCEACDRCSWRWSSCNMWRTF